MTSFSTFLVVDLAVALVVVVDLVVVVVVVLQVFVATLSFPEDYPLNPPSMKFVSEIFHPNIYPDGRVCISILHPPGNDPLGYETSAERWSPVQSVEKILLSVMSMIAEPNVNSPANVDAAVMWRDNIREFKRIAHLHVKKSLELDDDIDDEDDVVDEVEDPGTLEKVP